VKIPNSKSQIPNKFQAPNPKGEQRCRLEQREVGRRDLEFGIWSLFGIWDLGFGIFKAAKAA
jgi:hypothetical protein